MMSEITLDYLKACRLLLTQQIAISLLLVGCGGTGSWLAPSVVRVARLLIEKFNRKTSVYFIDPDRVEQKNCYRQNFCEAEVGRYKADALAYRYGLAWGIEVKAVHSHFGECRGLGDGLRVQIGCVDNAGARRQLADPYYENSPTWWLDCGNTKSAGQILLGSFLEKPDDPFKLGSVCTWLPLPSERHPDLLEDRPVELTPEADLSCADLAMLDSQSLSINQRMAAEASDYLIRLLITKDLRKMATYLDLEAGSTRSVYITPENVLVEK